MESTAPKRFPRSLSPQELTNYRLLRLIKMQRGAGTVFRLSLPALLPMPIANGSPPREPLAAREEQQRRVMRTRFGLPHKHTNRPYQLGKLPEIRTKRP